jgi:hypothetical protein
VAIGNPMIELGLYKLKIEFNVVNPIFFDEFATMKLRDNNDKPVFVLVLKATMLPNTFAAKLLLLDGSILETRICKENLCSI